VNAQQLLFWFFAAFTVISAVGVILAKSPMTSAMCLVASFFFLAGIYVLLWAHTIAVLQVLVYAGAIMVLFLFVIMLLSLTEASLRGPKLTFTSVVGAAVALGLFAFLFISFRQMSGQSMAVLTANQAQSFGTLRELGRLLYTTYLLPFEAISLLLLAAIVGAVVVAKPRI
jgi:NADH-quinone oxidoreductase subunit J